MGTPGRTGQREATGAEDGGARALALIDGCCSWTLIDRELADLLQLKRGEEIALSIQTGNDKILDDGPD